MERIPNTPILIIAFLISLLSTINVNGQTDSTKNSNTHSYFTLNLLSPLNTQSPRWRIGYIKDIDEKWKAGLDMGYGNRNLLFSDYGDNISKDYQLWEIRPEIYYIINPKRKTKKYFSLELFYINHTDIFYSGSYSSVNNESISYDQSDYKREKYGLNLKYGFIIYSKKRLGLNLYTGLGMKIRKNTFSNVLNPNLVDLGPEKGDMFGFDNYKNVEGTKLGANFSFGFKLYYKLNN
ncbi:MAG: hypothetical protein ABI295_04575 [Xanthomarina sp.]